MIRSRAILISIATTLVVCAAAVTHARDDAGDFIRRGKDALDDGRVREADSLFARAVNLADGGEREEALFLRAGVVRSGKEAEALYRQILDAPSSGEYADRARLELARIQFAGGFYEGAYATLHESDLCARSEDACLFEGMAALMLHHYDDATPALQRVRRGRERTWAALALAEAADGAGHSAVACAQYRSLAQARVSPAAWYRWAECLEKEGDREGAQKEFQALAEAFPLTPEAVRANEKRAMAAAPAPAASDASSTPAPAPSTGGDEKPRGSGYTIQFGSFGERANAIKLASEIKKMYPAVRIDSELVNFKEVFRVRCGFYATREAAESAGEEMTKTLGEPHTIMPVPANP